MSTALSALLPERVRSARPERHLRPLDMPGKRRRPKLVYAITAVAGAAIIGVAQLGFSIATTQTTYDIRHLTEQNRALKLEGQALYDEVAGLSSPQYLASNAAAMGMIVGGAPSYLRLSDGAIVGGATVEAAADKTTIDARRAGVANALVSNTPLVTNPDLTMTGQTKVAPEVSASTTIDALPTPQQSQIAVENPQVTAAETTAEGLPTPQTH